MLYLLNPTKSLHHDHHLCQNIYLYHTSIKYLFIWWKIQETRSNIWKGKNGRTEVIRNKTPWITSYSRIRNTAPLRGYQGSKRNNRQFFIKNVNQNDNLSTITIQIYEWLGKMSVNNRVGGKLNHKLEPETTIRMKLDNIKMTPQKYQLPWHKNITHHIKQTFFVSWTTNRQSH